MPSKALRIRNYLLISNLISSSSPFWYSNTK
nr:MAG TPA: hypothetical protein [Caudoviricetes sp.]